MSHPERSWGKALIDFFASLRLTIFLLIILSITSIFGTVIPQGDVPHEYLHGISQTKLKLYQGLDLYDMYHSIGILMILGIYGAFLMSHRRIWIRITDKFLLPGGQSLPFRPAQLRR